MNAKVQLTSSVEWHGRQVKELVLKEPNAGQFIRLGDPRIYVGNGGENSYFLEQPSVIASYIDELMIEPEAAGTPILPLLSLADGLTLKRALFGFFDLALAASFSSGKGISAGASGSSASKPQTA